MSHLDYYQYQARARGVRSGEDVALWAGQFGYLYERMAGGWLPCERAAPMADLACGHGSFLYWLQQKQYRDLIGVDASSEQAALGRAAGLSIVEGDALEWLEAQAAGKYQRLFAIDFIEHLAKPDFMRLLRAAREALGENGSLILRYPNGDSPLVGLNLFNDITHVWTYTTNCVQTLASMHGFRAVAFRDQGAEAIRDWRWLKVPLARVSARILAALFQAASRERIRYWNSSIWACLTK